MLNHEANIAIRAVERLNEMKVVTVACSRCSGDGVAGGVCPQCHGSGEMRIVVPTDGGNKNLSTPSERK